MKQKIEISKTKNKIGGCDTTLKAADETDLLQTIQQNSTKYDFDILVILF